MSVNITRFNRLLKKFNLHQHGGKAKTFTGIRSFLHLNAVTSVNVDVNRPHTTMRKLSMEQKVRFKWIILNVKVLIRNSSCSSGKT